MAMRSATVFTLLALVLTLTCTSADVPAARPTVPPGFTIERIARVDGPRELVVTPNGDLLAGTNGRSIVVVPDATGTPGAPATFVRLDDGPVAGVTLAGDTLYLGSQFGVWRLPYARGDRTASAVPQKIANVRTSGRSSDHVTTTVAVADGTLYASVGSSCNTCDPELDPTRASIQEMRPDGSGMRPRAVHVRNAIALAVEPASHRLWAGVAGQDELAHGHPYEIFDDVTAQEATPADYGWPYCYEDRRPAHGPHDCSRAAVPRVIFPAYETPIGATFYPAGQSGAYVFPERFRGGAFVTMHGSWHRPPVPPRVAFVPMHGDEPATPADFRDPTVQWQEFVGGFQSPDGDRLGRPTGVAVGPDGSLFVADDGANAIYRIRPATRTEP